MTKDEEAQLLRETHENNVMLRGIIKYLNMQISTSEQREFFLNLVANVIGNKIT